MSVHFVVDGLARLERSPEWQARVEAAEKRVCARYAKALAEAGPFRWCWLYWQMCRECGRERQRLQPSQQSLYGRACFWKCA